MTTEKDFLDEISSVKEEINEILNFGDEDISLIEDKLEIKHNALIFMIKLYEAKFSKEYVLSDEDKRVNFYFDNFNNIEKFTLCITEDSETKTCEINLKEKYKKTLIPSKGIDVIENFDNDTLLVYIMELRRHSIGFWKESYSSDFSSKKYSWYLEVSYEDDIEAIYQGNNSAPFNFSLVLDLFFNNEI